MALRVLIDPALVEIDAEESDRLLKLLEIVRLMVDGALLPDQGQLIRLQGHFEVLAEFVVALEAKQVQVGAQFVEGAPLAYELAAVKVEHFHQVLVDLALLFRGKGRRRRHIVRVKLHVAYWLFFLHHGFFLQLHFLNLILDFFFGRRLLQLVKVDKDDASASLQKVFDLSQRELGRDDLVIEDGHIRLEGSLVGKLDDLGPDHRLWVSAGHGCTDELARPLPLLRPDDPFELSFGKLLRCEVVGNADVLLKEAKAVRVIKQILAEPILGACLDHHTPRDHADLQPQLPQPAKRDLAGIGRINLRQDLADAVGMLQ